MQAPLKLYGVSGRYATALFQASSKKGNLQQVEGDLATLVAARKDAAFSAFLDDPTNKATKTKELVGLMKDLKVSETTANLMHVMAENGRLPFTEKVAEDFQSLMMASRGEVPATITSAEPLTKEELADVKAALGKMVKKGEKLNIDVKVNPEIIGGLIVDIGDKHIDLCIHTRIKKVEQMLAETS